MATISDKITIVIVVMLSLNSKSRISAPKNDNIHEFVVL